MRTAENPGTITRPAKNTVAVPVVRGPWVRLAPHPLAVDDEDSLLDRRATFERPLAVDLFCGAGGLSLGLSEAGFDVVLGVDHDEASLETHRAHHPGLSVNWDLSDPDVVESTAELVAALGVTLIAGGPPCQPFSSAGQSALRDLVRRGVRTGHDRRRDLWQSFLRIVSVARPAAVLMENVPEMALDRDMWILRTMVDELEEMGYSVEERLVTTADYGVPQMRHRLILIALHGGAAFTWPEYVPTVNLFNAIGDLPAVEGGWRPSNGDDPEDPVASGWSDYGAGPLTDFQRRMRRDVPPSWQGRVYDHVTRPVRDDDQLVFAQMDSTTRYSQIDPALRRYRDDIFDDKYKRLDWNQLSRTITAHIAKDGYWYIHPSQDRTLTVREAARIQTFPDHVRFAGTPSQAFRQIGNAVPPLLAEHLGTAIRASLEAGRHSRRSSQWTSMTLANWFDAQSRLSLPWLRAVTRWQVIMCEMLWGRASKDHTWESWAAVENFDAPSATLDPANLRALERYARLRGRGDRVASMVEAADWFRRSPSGLGDGEPVEHLLKAPGVGPSVADLAVRVRPGRDAARDEPVLVTYGVLRVAARYFDADVERRNRQSDGRMAVARMIGGGDDSHRAHLGLIELANSICLAGPAPDCGNCPLREKCEFAGSNGYGGAFRLTSRGS